MIRFDIVGPADAPVVVLGGTSATRHAFLRSPQIFAADIKRVLTQVVGLWGPSHV